MRLNSHFVQFAMLFASTAGFSQGTVVYDQQSSDESFIAGGVGIQPNQPLGQSFIPSLSAVGFIRLYLFDFQSGNSQGATIWLALLTDSIDGSVLTSTDSLFLPDGFFGTADFVFSTPAAVTPGNIYVFQPILEPSSDTWGTAAYNTYNYERGIEYSQGQPFPISDIWFREGIIVPEPSVFVLGVFGVGIWILRRSR